MKLSQRIEAELQQALATLRSEARDLADHAARVAAEIDERGPAARIPEALVRGAGARIDVLCAQIRFLRQLPTGTTPGGPTGDSPEGTE